jgi:hypothetical protein
VNRLADRRRVDGVADHPQHVGAVLEIKDKKDKALLFQCESSENCELCIGFSTTYCSTD